MNLDFVKNGVGVAKNSEGAIVRGKDKELLAYERDNFSVSIEINFLKDEAIIYRPVIHDKLPNGLSGNDLFSEILAGANALTRRKVRWQ